MALIPMVGRKSWQIRGLLAVLYTVLTLGAVTMVYPFLMMFSASVESQYDISSFDIVPRYLHTTPALFGKYAEDKYKGDITAINSAYGTSFATLADVTPPASGDAARLKDWDAFVRDHSDRISAFRAADQAQLDARRQCQKPRLG
jgi:ABC-type glycerol-3-phosphate transport system permease component